MHYARYNHQAQATPMTPATANNGIFSAASSDSFDSDGEVLPMASAPLNASQAEAQDQREGSVRGNNVTSEEGKWFQALDERYLLPLFSNATASRTFHARRARRSPSGPLGQFEPSPLSPTLDSEDEGDSSEVTLGVRSPAPERGFPPSPTPAEQSRSELGLASPMLRSPRDGEGQGRS